MENLTLTLAEVVAVLDARGCASLDEPLAWIGQTGSGFGERDLAWGASSLFARQLIRLEADGGIVAAPELAAVATALLEPILGVAFAEVSEQIPPTRAMAVGCVLQGPMGPLAVVPGGLMTYRFRGLIPTSDVWEVVGSLVTATIADGRAVAVRAARGTSESSVLAHRHGGAWRVDAHAPEHAPMSIDALIERLRQGLGA